MLNNYLNILKITFKNSFRTNRESKKKQIGVMIGIALGFTPLIIFISFGTYNLGKILPLDYSARLITMVFLSAQFVTMFFGIFSIINYMFLSKDAGFLSALPIKKSTVYLAKLSQVYFYELLITSFILIPTIISLGLGLSAAGASIPIIYYILGVLSVFAMPILPLLVVSILAFPMMYVVSYFKNRSFLTTVVTIILFAGIFILYYSAIGSFTNVNQTQVENLMMNILDKVGNIGFFDLFYANAMVVLNGVGDAILNLLYFILINCVFLAISIFIASKLYAKGVTIQLEEAVKTGKKEDISNQESSTKAVMKREIKMLTRNPSFALQSFMGPVLAPILMVFIIGMNRGGGPTDFSSTNQIYGMGMYFCLLMIHGINYVSSVAITREGKFFYINKYLPISNKELINGKILFAYAFASLGIIIATIVIAILAPFNLINLVLFIICNFLYGYGFVTLGILRDLKKPKLDWVNVQQAIKQNFNAMVPMFYALALGLAPLGLSFIPMPSIARLLMWTIHLGISLTLAIANHKRLYNNLDTLMYNIQS